MQNINFGLCVCARTRESEAGCWPISKRRRQDSVLVQTLGEEGAGSVAVRNRNRREKKNPGLFSFPFACW